MSTKSQDSALLTAPFEALRRVSRDRKHVLEAAGKLINELKSLNAVSNKQDSAIRLRAQELVKSCAALQQQAKELESKEADLVSICDKRAEHFHQVWKPKDLTEARSAPEWDECRFDRMLADYLVRQCYLSTAQKVMLLKNVEHLVDVRFYAEVDPIAASLRQKQCQPALNWCRQNAGKLKKQKSRLEFDLHCQVYIEMVREGDKLEALKYASSHLKPYLGQHTAEVRHILVGLVVSDGPGWKKHQNVFDESRWQDLQRTFYKDAHQMNNMPVISQLELYLQTGLIVLNPPPHYTRIRRGQEPGIKSGQDPWSQKVFQEMSKKLPYAGHAQMRLICPMSGQVIDNENKGYMLPNKQIVAQRAVEEIKVRGKDKSYYFIHPTTGEKYTQSQWTEVRPV